MVGSSDNKIIKIKENGRNKVKLIRFEPGMTFYSKSNILEGKGEKWFSFTLVLIIIIEKSHYHI